MSMRRYLNKLSSDPLLPMNKPNPPKPIDPLLVEAEDAIIAAMSIIEVTKIEWQQEGCWGEYDQSVLARCGAVLSKIDSAKKSAAVATR